MPLGVSAGTAAGRGGTKNSAGRTRTLGMHARVTHGGWARGGDSHATMAGDMANKVLAATGTRRGRELYRRPESGRMRDG